MAHQDDAQFWNKLEYLNIKLMNTNTNIIYFNKIYKN